MRRMWRSRWWWRRSYSRRRKLRAVGRRRRQTTAVGREGLATWATRRLKWRRALGANVTADFPASVAYELAPAHQCPPSLPAESARRPLLPRSSLRPPPPSSLPPTAVEAEAAAATALAPARYFPASASCATSAPYGVCSSPAVARTAACAASVGQLEQHGRRASNGRRAAATAQGPARFQAPASRQVQRRVVQLEEQSIAQINGRLGLSNGNQPVVCADCISYSMRYGLAFSECRQTCPRQRQQQASTQDSFWRTDLEMSQSSHPPSSQARHNFGSQSQQLHSNWVEDSQGFLTDQARSHVTLVMNRMKNDAKMNPQI